MTTRSAPRRMAGFSLIELMIVVAIIGILASIVIPNFLTFRCKAKTTEAQNILAALRNWQMSYYAENDEYFCPMSATDLAGLANAGFDFSRAQYHVLYMTCPAGRDPVTDFLMQMESTWDGPSGIPDTWIVNNAGNLWNSVPGCY